MADAFGLVAEVVPVEPGQGLGTLRHAAQAGSYRAISLSAKTAHALAAELGASLLEVIASFPALKTWFIHSSPAHGAAETTQLVIGGVHLTLGATAGIQKIQAAPVAGAFSGPIAGFSWEPAAGSQARALRLHRPDDQYTPLLTTAQGDLSGIVQSPAALLVISGVQGIPDLDEPITTDYEFIPRLHQWLPLLVFFRAAFGRQLWHNPLRSACFVIDDPMLVRKYGCLDFAKVLQSLQHCHGHLSLAYIPYNHSRVDAEVARLFREHARWLSLCVHGNDHTQGEFAELDTEALSVKATAALARMDRLKARERLSYDPVMVFPQGKFSRQGMEALKRAGYWAAVNSGAIAQEGPPGEFRIRDYLLPAVTAYESFPLFNRRYPKSLLEFAVDGFLEKPILFVEHHGYFKDAGRDLVEKIEAVNGWGWRHCWQSLGSIVQQTAWERSPTPDQRAVRLFSPQCVVRNPEDRPIHHRFTYPENRPELVVGVWVDDRPQEFVREPHAIRFELCLPPQSARTLRIAYQPVPIQGRSRVPLSSRRVWVRRRLSEFRDQQLAPHPRLLNAATGLVRLLRRRRAKPD